MKSLNNNNSKAGKDLFESKELFSWGAIYHFQLFEKKKDAIFKLIP